MSRQPAAVKPAPTKYPIPTGYLFTDYYSKGPLETLTIGDYGKRHNVKAAFLGYDRDIEGVPNMPCMPLSEKWVVTLSTQYGCRMKCSFCDVPKVPWRGNATEEDLRRQLYSAIAMFPECQYTERLNIHFARMGEPIFNPAVFSFSRWLHERKGRELRRDTGLRVETLHPVLTTSMPRKFGAFRERIIEWCRIKNETYFGQAGLQFSINSTDEGQRTEMFADQQMHLVDFARFARTMPTPVSRKYCLNFALADSFAVDAGRLKSLFDTDKFMVKLTPIHNNDACRDNGIATADGYDSFKPYSTVEADLRAEGFDVLVFIPSIDEEEGLVTCGNAVLGGSQTKPHSAVRIHGITRDERDADSTYVPGGER